MAWARLLGCVVMWFAGAIVVERFTPMEWRSVADPIVVLSILISFVGMIVHIELHPRIQCLKLGEQLLVVPRRRLDPKDVRAFRIAPDPDEDYVETVSPVALCQLTVDPRKGSLIRLVITTGDAARRRSWAERRGVPVDDPEGYSAPASPKRPVACRADGGLRM